MLFVCRMVVIATAFVMFAAQSANAQPGSGQPAKPRKWPEKPNIIYIMADDLGYGDLGCYGQKIIKTPNIDQMAREGVCFSDHYSGHTVCRPSRLSLLTGKTTRNTAISSNEQYTLPIDATTVTSLLQRAGYATGGVGKWALGAAGSNGSPTNQGFDFWFGYLDQSEAHNYYPEVLWKNNTAIKLPGNKVGDQKRVSVERTTYAHTAIVNEAMGFIERNKDRPFFLQAHFTIPHANNEGGKATGDGMEIPDHGQYAGQKWPEPEKGFAAMVSQLDADVGNILKQLRTLGIEKRTLVLFTSDNGPHSEGGHNHEFFDSNGPLRGYKRDLYDGGIRVPLIAWWPGTVDEDEWDDHTSAFWDFLPTACELAGVDPPDDIDGISYVPTLLGEEQPAHESLYWQFNGKIAIRDGRWKAVRPHEDAEFELYDIYEDEGEESNLAEVRGVILDRLTSDRGN